MNREPDSHHPSYIIHLSDSTGGTNVRSSILPARTDADVAYLYGVETREVNQAVKNNPEKFPAHYMFELTPSELRDLKSKVLISNVSNNSRRGATMASTRGNRR